LSNEEKTNDYENFEKGMIYMKICKRRGVVEKRGRRKRNPCPMRLCLKPFLTIFQLYIVTASFIGEGNLSDRRKPQTSG
jgi:hypothetical protein